mgnify:CR=1 FL=1
MDIIISFLVAFGTREKIKHAREGANVWYMLKQNKNTHYFYLGESLGEVRDKTEVSSKLE